LSARTRTTVSDSGTNAALTVESLLPIDTPVQAFYNAETPEHGPDWQLRL